MGRQVTGTKEEKSVVASDEPNESHEPNEVAAPAMQGGAVGVPNQVAEVQQSERVFEAPVVARKQVLRMARVNLGYGITFLQAGQIVDANNYDFAALKAQGVMLGEVGSAD